MFGTTTLKLRERRRGIWLGSVSCWFLFRRRFGVPGRGGEEFEVPGHFENY